MYAEPEPFVVMAHSSVCSNTLRIPEVKIAFRAGIVWHIHVGESSALWCLLSCYTPAEDCVKTLEYCSQLSFSRIALLYTLNLEEREAVKQ